MNTCALCRKKEANKTNTHYLTDAVIKRCLNLDGGKERGKGIYWDISTNNEFVGFNFQQNASGTKALEEAMGREPNEEEIKKALKNPFAVDNVFCDDCENKFKEIEDSFHDNYLHKFREGKYNGLSLQKFKDCLTFRLYFLLQVWRNSVCEPNFNISPKSKESLRKLILKPDEGKLKEFPLALAYLEHGTNLLDYGRNILGCSNEKNPFPIFMCDFIIQFYESLDDIRYNSLLGVNDKKFYTNFINIKESEFVVQIIQEEQKTKIQDNQALVMASIKLNKAEERFAQVWEAFFGNLPSRSLRIEFRQGLANSKDIPTAEWWKEENVKAYIQKFIIARGESK